MGLDSAAVLTVASGGNPFLERALAERRGAAEGAVFKPIRRGWGLGEQAFRQELLTQMSERLGAETTMTAGWNVERLEMGSRGCLNHLLYGRRKSREV